MGDGWPRIRARPWLEGENIVVRSARTIDLRIQLVLGWAAISLFLVLTRAESLPLAQAVFGCLIGGAGLLPLLVYLSTPSADRPIFPLMVLTGVFYGVFFGFSVFLLRHQINKFGRIFSYNMVELEQIGLHIQFMVLDGIGMMYVGWMLARRWLSSCVSPIRFAMPSNTFLLHAMFWGFALLFLLYFLSPQFRAVPSIGQLIQPGGYIAMAGFTYLYLKGDLGRGQTFAYFLVYLPAWYFTVLMSSFLTPIILSVILLAVMHIRVRGWVPWTAGLLAVVVVVVVYPGSQLYRQMASRSSTELSTTERMGQFARSLTYVYTDRQAQSARWQGLAQRTSAIVPFAIVAKRTPAEVSYWGGTPYRPLLTSWIPRVIWPGKPREVAGAAFGHRFKLLHPDDNVTSLNLPWLTEAYANFGPGGMVFVMLAIGLFLGLLERRLATPSDNAVGWAVGTGVLLPLAFPESNLSVMTGSLLPLIISLWVMFRIAQAVSRRLPGSAT